MREILMFFMAIWLNFSVLANAKHEEIGRNNDTIPTNNCPLFDNDTEASKIVLSIIDHAGVCPNFEIREADIANAKAVIRDNQRVILYNTEYIKSINQKGSTNWAGIGVLAHEIGHHLNGHTFYFDRSDYEAELEADNFAGFILRRMGANLNQAQAAINAVCKEKCTKTHPGRSTRLKAIETGWTKADKQIKRVENLNSSSKGNISKS